MIPKKIFVIAIILSLAVHIVFLALSGFLGGYDGTDEEDVLPSALKTSEQNRRDEQQWKETAGDSVKNAGQSIKNSAVDTIDLDSTNTKYYPYLLQVRESIDTTWSYPEDAFIRGGERNYSNRVFNNRKRLPCKFPCHRFIRPRIT